MEHPEIQKQASRGVLRKMFSENMHQINTRTPMPKCKDFNEPHFFLKKVTDENWFFVNDT